MVTTGENMRMMKRSPGNSSAGSRSIEAGVGACCPGRMRRGAFQQAHLGFDLRRAGMKVHRRAVLQRLRRGQQIEAAIDLLHGAGSGRARSARRRASSSAGSISARLTRGALSRARRGPRCCRAPARRARAGGARRGRLPLPAPCATDPEISVPVATVPKPFTENDAVDGQAEVARRVLFADVARATRASSRRRSSSPAPVTELTGTMGAPSRKRAGRPSPPPRGAPGRECRHPPGPPW